MKLTDIMNDYCEMLSVWSCMTEVTMYTYGTDFFMERLVPYNLMDRILNPDIGFVCTVKFGKIEVFKGEVIR